MKNDREVRIISIVAILLAVIGISLGFAAFSTSLKISSSATVQPEDTFRVEFSTKDGSLLEGAVTPTTSPEEDGITASNATITNQGNQVKITGLHVVFTKPGQSATYTFYIANTGKYDAYLKEIIYANVSSESSKKTCTPKVESTLSSSSQQACNGILLKVKVGENLEKTDTDSAITNHLLSKGKYEKIEVTISYEKEATMADDSFDVKFGDVTLTYKSTDAA